MAEQIDPQQLVMGIANDTMALVENTGGTLEGLQSLIQEIEDIKFDQLNQAKLDTLKSLANLACRMALLPMVGDDPPEMAEMPRPFDSLGS